MIKVSVFTSTRAEYGLFSRLLSELDNSADFELQLVVAGTHLSHEYGYTVDEILEDGFTPAIMIPTMISDDSPQSVTKSSALLSITLADYFAREQPDFFIVLGDRFELLAAGAAAMVAKIPIVHIHGGEITEGAVDEKVRHALTKMSNLHFTSTEIYRRRVIQMGEAPELVVNCGALGLEEIHAHKFPSVSELSGRLGIELGTDYFLIVYHPETNKDEEDIADLIDVLSQYRKYNNVFIYPNSDIMSRGIIKAIEEYRLADPERVSIVKSTSRVNYLSLIKYCDMYIGNSSSGVIEVPSFHKPIINIGDRQKGRIRSSSVIDATLSRDALKVAMEKALSSEYRNNLPAIENPYEGETPSSVILCKLRELAGDLRIEKTFRDMDIAL